MKKLLTAILIMMVSVGVASAVTQTSTFSTKRPPRTNSKFYTKACDALYAIVNTDIVNLTAGLNGLTNAVSTTDITATGANTATLDFNMGSDTNVIMSTTTYKQSTPAANIEDDDKRVVVQLQAYNDATQAVDYVTVEYKIDDASDTSEDGSMVIKAYKAGSSTTLVTIDASGITVVGDVSGTTIGGITEANLVDKSATETIAGAWTFQNAPNLTNGVTGTFTNSVDETLTFVNGVVTGGTGIK